MPGGYGRNNWVRNAAYPETDTRCAWVPGVLVRVLGPELITRKMQLEAGKLPYLLPVRRYCVNRRGGTHAEDLHVQTTMLNLIPSFTTL